MDDKNPLPKRISIRDVAAAAGLSHTAVSMALRSHPSIPQHTRERIIKLAKEIGYQPDADMAKLMEHMRSKRRRRLGNVIAYITAFPERDAWKNVATYRIYFESAQERAKEAGFKLEEFWLREEALTARRLGEILRSRAIENVIIAPLPGKVHEQQKWFNGFPWHYFSVVALGYSLNAFPVNRVCFNHFEGMSMLMRELKRLGYRRPGLTMSQSLDDRTHNYYRSAYLNEISLTKKFTSVPIDIRSDWTLDGFEEWYLKNKPDIVITFDLSVRERLLKLGRSIPGDVGFALIDLTEKNLKTGGINQHSKVVAHAAVDMLLAMNRIDDRGIPEHPRVLMSEGSLSHGKTLSKQ